MCLREIVNELSGNLFRTSETESGDKHRIGSGMSKATRKRPLTGGMAVVCALLDAAALRLDLSAAEGRRALIRGPLAMGFRGLSRVLRFWNTCWVGRYLGLAWVIQTYRRGSQRATRS